LWQHHAVTGRQNKRMKKLESKLYLDKKGVDTTVHTVYTVYKQDVRNTQGGG
jgi:hypothetical protein